MYRYEIEKMVEEDHKKGKLKPEPSIEERDPTYLFLNFLFGSIYESEDPEEEIKEEMGGE